MLRSALSARVLVGSVALAIAASFFACSDSSSAVDPEPQGAGDGLPPREDAEAPTGDDASTDAAINFDDADTDAAPPKDGDGGVDGGGGFTYKPVPSGCVTAVNAGNHVFTCSTLRVDATIPDMLAKCPAAGCGLILSLHGDTGTGPAMDAHTTLRTRGSQRGYIVLAPTGPAIGTIGGVAYPGSTWGPAQDANLIAMVRTFITVFKADPKRVHVAGFSRGGFAAWRFACDQSNLFASVAVGGAGNGAVRLLGGAEATCFEAGRAPARRLDLLMLMGRTDSLYPKMVSLRDNALANYTLGVGDQTLVKQSGTAYTHRRATKTGVPTVEWIDHAYEVDTAAPPLYAGLKGHCVPGSTVAVNAPAYAVACKRPNGIDWGAEALTFFDAHPRP